MTFCSLTVTSYKALWLIGYFYSVKSFCLKGERSFTAVASKQENDAALREEPFLCSRSFEFGWSWGPSTNESSVWVMCYAVTSELGTFHLQRSFLLQLLTRTTAFQLVLCFCENPFIWSRLWLCKTQPIICFKRLSSMLNLLVSELSFSETHYV